MPASTPSSIIGRLHSELVKIMQRSEIKEKLMGIGMDNSTHSSPALFKAMLKDEVVKWSAVVKTAGIQPE